MGKRKGFAGILTFVVAGALLLLAPMPAGATAAPFCGITWGSRAKSAEPMVTSPITGVRTGQHRCYDRLVVDLKGPAPGYRVSYVPEVTQDGSGLQVMLRGGAKLQVVVLAPAYDTKGRPTFPIGDRELAGVKDFRTFRQVAGAGSFEGQTTIGLGVRAPLPFRVFTLPGPGANSRLVIDVAHRWA
ncbi:MAG: AMIN-like domain-containing (lipo)protein [Egibacteraceae bacterium]